jgi:predicted DNA-binding ribbon-helix-helix protein
MDRSPVVKRSVVIEGHKTSVSLEVQFWNNLKMIAKQRHTTLSEVVGEIDQSRMHGNLSSAIRLHVLDWAIKGGVHHANPNPVATHQRGTAPA